MRGLRRTQYFKSYLSITGVCGLYWSSHGELSVTALVGNWPHAVMALNWCFSVSSIKSSEPVLKMHPRLCMGSAFFFHKCALYRFSLVHRINANTEQHFYTPETHSSSFIQYSRSLLNLPDLRCRS